MVMVKLMSALAEIYAIELVEIEYYSDMTIRTLLDKCKIYPGNVGLILIDGYVGDLNKMVVNNCVVELYPIFGGG
jgi:hypothetical protein